jgi:hypothetical protein
MAETVNWSDPASRAHFIRLVGPDRYNEAHVAQMKASVVAVVNGYDIRPVESYRFGRIFMVDGLDMRFTTQLEAELYAAQAARAPTRDAGGPITARNARKACFWGDPAARKGAPG